MFIHLSDDITIRMSDVVVILNYQSIYDSTINKVFLDKVKKNKHVIDMAEEVIKSIVVTKDNVYFTPFSTATLKKRSQLSVN